MKKLKVAGINAEELVFNDGTKLQSNHDQEGSEIHYLCFGDLDMSDFDGLEFDMSADNFFNRIEGYGIELVPLKGFPVRVPGYGSNNGYYNANIDLLIIDADGKTVKSYNVSDCQDYEP